MKVTGSLPAAYQVTGVNELRLDGGVKALTYTRGELSNMKDATQSVLVLKNNITHASGPGEAFIERKPVFWTPKTTYLEVPL
jgi:hypothetical protein